MYAAGAVGELTKFARPEMTDVVTKEEAERFADLCVVKRSDFVDLSAR